MAGLIPFNRKRNDVMNTGFEDFSNMIDDFFTGSWPLQRSLVGDTFKIDIQDNDTEYTIEAELPGVKKEDIEITLNEGRLNISVKKEEVSRKEINGLVFVTYDDGSVEITMAPITLTKEQVEDIFGEIQIISR